MSEPSIDVKTGNIGENSQFAVGKNIKQEYNSLPATDSKPAKIEDLLAELKKAIDDPNLSEEDKSQSSEQLKVLAETGQDPKDETMQKKAKKAVGFLKVIAEGVEPTTKLAQACAKVLPKILVFFGL